MPLPPVGEMPAPGNQWMSSEMNYSKWDVVLALALELALTLLLLPLLLLLLLLSRRLLPFPSAARRALAK